MAKRRIEEPPKKTALTIKKGEFTSELQGLIGQGKEIYDRQVNTVEELDKAERDGYNWGELTEEFLKHAFNNPINEYKNEFESAGSFIGIEDVLSRRVDTNHPKYKLDKFKEKLDAKLNNLNNLLSKLKYIPSEVESFSSSQTQENFSEEEKTKVNEKIDEVLNKLHELQVGQEVIFNEIEELRGLLSLDKKNWKQVLKGKLVDLGLGKLVDTDTLEWIYKKLTDENLNLLNS
jgi:hypothetical protein